MAIARTRVTRQLTASEQQTFPALLSTSRVLGSLAALSSLLLELRLEILVVKATGEPSGQRGRR
jgi:hypothetical protein